MNFSETAHRRMLPFRFDGGTSSLFGVYHEPTDATPAREGVVLCPPFGQEAVRSHRMFRVLAERLSRQGFATLRFDFHGTGDSDGDGLEASIRHWSRDVLAADAELRRRSACSKVSWIGLRLGATIAALASGDARLNPDSLLLVDPIVIGADWLRELRESNVTALRQVYGLPQSEWSSLHKLIVEESATESVGFPLTESFKSEIAELDESIFAATRCRRLVYLIGRDDPGTLRLRRMAPVANISAAWVQVPESNWKFDDPANASMVPSQLLAAVVAALSDAPA